MSPTPDFNESELWTAPSTLNQRYGREIEIGDTDVRLNLHTAHKAPCPTLYWQADYVAKHGRKSELL